jgi:hypothetical protein
MSGRLRFAASTLAVCALLSQALGAAAQPDPGALSALAERLARDSALGSSEIELFAGAIPALPVAFTPPPGTRVIGTAVERARPAAPATAARFTRFRIYLTLTGTPEAAVDAIAAGFASGGYARTPALFGSAPGGFATASPVVANFCRAAGDPRVLVRARTVGASTDAVVEETVRAPGGGRELGGPCEPDRRPDPLAGLPVLRSARAVAVVTRANALAPDATTQTADVFTTLAARTVLDGWTADAVAGGWTLRSVTSTDEIAVAALARELEGHPRTLVISIARVRPGQYYASLTNAATPAEPNALPPGR